MKVPNPSRVAGAWLEWRQPVPTTPGSVDELPSWNSGSLCISQSLEISYSVSAGGETYVEKSFAEAEQGRNRLRSTGFPKDSKAPRDTG